MLLCAALAAYPAASSAGRVLAVAGAAGAVAAAAALVFGWEQLVPWALGILGAEYAVSLFVRGGGTANSAPLVGAGLLLLGELLAWSLSLRTRMHEEPPVLLLRLAAIGAAVTASVAVGTLLVALAATDVGGSAGWTALGTAAAVGAVALVTRAAR